MAYRSMYAYAWDIAELGARPFAEQLKALHINSITLACAYHAGKFLRPNGIGGKVYFPEDGTAYFKTDPDRYGEIAPIENSLMSQRDVLEECCELDDMDVFAWMVLTHNSLLGQKHKHCCVSNAFGDRYIYNLCPANPATRAYVASLCTDLTQRYGVTGITLETPGYLPYVHGYHHEFALVRQNTWLNNMLGLCFCEHCLQEAGTAGIDAAGLQSRIAGAIQDYLSSDIDFPDDMADAFWQADLICDQDLNAYLRQRCQIVETLVQEIRAAVRDDAQVSVIPSVARPTGGAWYEGSDIKRLAEIADFVEVCFYEPGPDRVASDLHDVSRRCGGVEKIRGILRPGFPDLANRGDVMSAVDTLVSGGVSDLAFYNYGHLRKPSLDWVGEALGALETA